LTLLYWNSVYTINQHKEDNEDSSQCFVDWNSPPTYNTYVIDEDDLIEVEEKFVFEEEEIVDPF
jgi:hypothetical protein